MVVDKLHRVLAHVGVEFRAVGDFVDKQLNAVGVNFNFAVVDVVLGPIRSNRGLSIGVNIVLVSDDGVGVVGLVNRAADSESAFVNVDGYIGDFVR